MAQKVDQELFDRWRQRIEQQRQGGLTVAEFSRQDGISEGNFYAWKRRLQGKPRTKSKQATRRRPTGTRAVSVRTVPEPASEAAFVQLPLTTTGTSPWIELVLAEGTVIRIPQQNLAALQTVLGALGGACRSPSIREA